MNTPTLDVDPNATPSAPALAAARQLAPAYAMDADRGDTLRAANLRHNARVIDAHFAPAIAALRAMLETPYQSVAEQTETFAQARAVLAAHDSATPRA